MGVDTQVYVVYGIKHEWDDTFAEVYDERYEDPYLPEVVLDGMCGEYMIFGKPLFVTASHRWDASEGDVYKEINPSLLMRYEQEYRENFYSVFPEFYNMLDKPFQIIAFIHYS